MNLHFFPHRPVASQETPFCTHLRPVWTTSLLFPAQHFANVQVVTLPVSQILTRPWFYPVLPKCIWFRWWVAIRITSLILTVYSTNLTLVNVCLRVVTMTGSTTVSLTSRLLFLALASLTISARLARTPRNCVSVTVLSTGAMLYF